MESLYFWFKNILNQGWFGAIVGLVGIIYAVYTTKKNKIGPRLVYQWESLKIIGKNEVTPEEIEIFFKGIKVPRVIKTTIIIWNSGTKTIHGENIVKNDSLRLEFENEQKIIGASILLRTKEVNEFEISTNADKKNILNINFEYLDPQDGVTIEILHTDVNRYPNFLGTVKGMPVGPKNWSNKSNGKSTAFLLANQIVYNFIFKSKLILWVAFILGIGLMAFSVIVPYFYKELAIKISESNSQFSVYITVFIIGLTYTLVSALGFWGSRKRYPKSLNIEKNESGNRASSIQN